MKKLLFLLFLLFLLVHFSALSHAEEKIKIPMTVKHLFGETTVNLSATLYKPEGEGPFPLVIINHGTPRDSLDYKRTLKFKSQSKVFVKRGFAVVVPMRRGRGDSEGTYAESHGKCEKPDYYYASMEGAKDIKAVIDYMIKQPYVDKTKILIVGQSTGGYTSLALGSMNIEGVIGIINFAGGRGSTKDDFVCAPNTLIWTAGKFGKTSRVPTLWIYTENDKYFAPSISKEMFEEYVKNGGKGKFVLLPPFMEDGHKLFHRKEGMPIWIPIVDEFLRELGFKFNKLRHKNEDLSGGKDEGE